MARTLGTGQERHAAAREAMELQRAEKGADKFLGMPAQTIPEGATESPKPILEEEADRVPAEFAGESAEPAPPSDIEELTQQAIAGGEYQGPGPAILEEGYPGISKSYPAADPKTAELTRMMPFHGEKLPSELEPPQMGAREQHMTRDRPELRLEQMSQQELKDARGRLVSAMATEPSGSQADAYAVLLNRLDRAIDSREAESLEVSPEEESTVGR